ncbi:hypothetical protein BH10ACT11_BH10ACT11_08520 [soil metagenome]
MGEESGIDVAYVASADGRDDGWTVLSSPVAVAIGFVPSLTCFPRSWDRQPPSWAAGGELRDVAHESLEFERMYHSQADISQQENWLRQLLSPSFVHWLSSVPEGSVGFEVHEGTVRCFRKGRLDDEQLAGARGGIADRDAASLDSFILGALQFVEKLEKEERDGAGSAAAAAAQTGAVMGAAGLLGQPGAETPIDPAS